MSLTLHRRPACMPWLPLHHRPHGPTSCHLQCSAKLRVSVTTLNSSSLRHVLSQSLQRQSPCELLTTGLVSVSQNTICGRRLKSPVHAPSASAPVTPCHQVCVAGPPSGHSWIHSPRDPTARQLWICILFDCPIVWSALRASSGHNPKTVHQLIFSLFGHIKIQASVRLKLLTP